MKLDLDLVREILIEIENSEPLPADVSGRSYIDCKVENRSEEELCEHIRLMEEAGLIDALRTVHGNKVYHWLPVRLTWAGHSYLAEIKSDTVYNKSKEIAGRAFGGITLETMKAALPLALQALAKANGLG